jgi:hypothetical protein
MRDVDKLPPSSQWTIDEDNRKLTSDDLIVSLLEQASKQSQRDELKKWLYCEGGDWSLGHTNPTKSGLREIAIWDQPRILSVVIESGIYEQKLIPGSTRKLALLEARASIRRLYVHAPST